MPLIKNNNEQKKHKGENIIGKIIYGFLLFAPLLNILVTCMYVTFNKNAYQSYSQKVDTTIEKVKNNDIINAGTLLTITYNGGALYDNPFQMYVLNGDTDINKFFPNETFIVDRFNLLQSGGRTRLQVFDTNNNSYNVFNWEQTYNDFYFVNKDELTFTTINNANFNLTYITYVSGSLDNAFIYGTQKTEESNLFNWSKTTGTYTVLNNTCNLLGITNTFTPMLLAYWLIISVIYFIYDIALILVWMVHKKIHELTDAI